MSRCIAGFCVVVLVGAAIAIVQSPASAGDSWLTILWAAWVIAMAWALSRPSFSFLFTAIMTAMLLFVIIPATEAQLSGFTTIGGYNYRAGVVRALEISALAQCGLLVGAVAARTFWPVPRMVKIFPQLAPARLDRAARLAVLAGVLAVLALSVLGGASLRSFFVYTTSSGYGTFAKETTGYFGYLASIQCVAGLVLVLLPLRLTCHGSRRKRVLLYVALAAFVLLGGGQRARFFIPAFAAGLIWLKTSQMRRPPQRRLAVIGLIVLVVFGGLIGVARGAAQSRHVSVSTVFAASAGSANDLFLPLAGLASTVPGQFPYLGGTSYLEIATFLVPRALWNGKPQGSISTLTTAVDPGNSGLAFPEFGEIYANFGLAGVMIGSLLLGSLIELISRRLARSTSIGESVFTAVCAAVLLGLFIRGDIAPLLISYAGLLAMTALVCRPRSPMLAEPLPVPAAPLLRRNSRRSVML
jgi:oligosaccharide repeat unit polymerase